MLPQLANMTGQALQQNQPQGFQGQASRAEASQGEPGQSMQFGLNHPKDPTIQQMAAMAARGNAMGAGAGQQGLNQGQGANPASRPLTNAGQQGVGFDGTNGAGGNAYMVPMGGQNMGPNSNMQIANGLAMGQNMGQRGMIINQNGQRRMVPL